MQDKEFNLLDEGWIKVLAPDLSVKEVSLVDALINAHNYRSLSGEMPTQDFAVLRLLLACMQTIFYRYDAQGKPSEIDGWWDKEDILARWKEFWDKGSFSEEAVTDYFKQYHERFWLFHPETPFYQVPDLKYGTDYGVQSLYGNIKSSNHKTTKYHFSMYEGEFVQNTGFPEAARWLLHLNGFGVNVKNKEEAPGTTNPAGVGRLGRLGLIFSDGKNLFELIMLNLTPLNPANEAWENPNPVWEQKVRTLQSIEIAPPGNLPELYTLQSRRIMLVRNGGTVSGFRALNGDYYPVEDDFNEQMTIWRRNEDKKTHKITYIPQKHSPEIQAWREFPVIFDTADTGHVPGVVSWINTLCENSSALDGRLLTFNTVGIIYGDKSYTFGDCLSDGITLSAGILKKFSREWIKLITDEIDKCSIVAEKAIRNFAKKIAAVFNGDGKTREKYLKEKFYSQIDAPFRGWAASIQPDICSKETIIEEWEEAAYGYARNVISEYVSGIELYVGRMKETENRIVSIPGAYNEYLMEIRSIYPKIKKTGRKENMEDEHKS